MILALGAVGKIAWVPQFAAIIRAAADLPAGMAFVAVYVIIAWEAALAIALSWGGWRSRVTIGMAGVTIALFTLALLRLWTVGAPSCGCLGVLSGNSTWELPIALARNVGMLLVLGWCLTTTRITLMSAVPEHARSGRRVAGFTIVEILVAVAVVVIIVGMALPALRAARKRGRDGESLSGLRQVMAGIAVYANDHRDSWPYIQTPGDFGAPLVVRGVVTGFSYFGGGRTFWANALVPDYLPMTPMLLSLPVDDALAQNQRNGLDPATVRSRFILSDVAFVRPEWFSGDDPPLGDRLFRGTRHSEVAFPSRKGAMVDGRRILGVSDARPVTLNGARADGAAGMLPFGDPEPATSVPRWLYGVIYAPVFSTRDGWRGIDKGL